MSSSEVDSRIKEIMSGVFDVSPAEIGNGFRRDDASAWDSMNHLRLVSALEEAFGIKLTMKEVGEMESFDDVRRKIAERLDPVPPLPDPLPRSGGEGGSGRR